MSENLDFDTSKKSEFNAVSKFMQHAHLILIIIHTLILSIGGTFISIRANSQNVNQNLINTSKLISEVYKSVSDYSTQDLCNYFNEFVKNLEDVDVISIIDSKNNRLYHTNNGLITSLYMGGVPNFEEDEHKLKIYDEQGPSGPQRRCYSPIYDKDGKYLGFIITIVLKNSIRTIYKRTFLLFIIVTLLAVILEILIAKFMNGIVKKKLLGYEPEMMSSMFLVRDTVLESINEGIIAFDNNKQIQYINKSAQQLLNKSSDKKSFTVNETLFKNNFFEKIVFNGESFLGMHDRTSDGKELLIDCIPLKNDKKNEGVIVILHDRSEYTKMAEDLSGTTYLVDSIRANNYDFINKLNVIMAFIQIGEYDKAISYIQNISIIQREILSKVMNSIDNPSLSALLIGKISRAAEHNIKFILQPETNFKNADFLIPSENLVTIVGNLIDNALDSMKSTTDFDVKEKELTFCVVTKPGELLITVKDTGEGISDDIKEKIFDNGFSTKSKGRGIGLFHTKYLIESHGGKLSFESKVGEGTTFTVKI